jgi:stage II sporulation protein D
MQLTALLGSAVVLGLLAALLVPTRLNQRQAAPPVSGETIRVLLSYKPTAPDFEGQHVFPSLELTPLNEPMSVKSGPDGQNLSLAFSALPQRPVRFTVQDGNITAALDGQTYTLGKVVLLKAVVPETAGKIRYRITSTTRGSPAVSPEYPGQLWLSALGTGILVTNEVGMQEYLERVVPSEMPPFFHPEALAAQAVAARTYAYSRMIASPERNFWKQFGADLDDSVNEQVYNATPTHPATDAAVAASRGQILTYGGQPVQAYFFSTSPGSTATVEEVWPDREPQPYLKAQVQAYPIPVAIAGEATALAFFKNWRREGYYDGDSSLFRWKVSLSREELEAILSKTLPATAKISPEFVENPEGTQSLDTPDFKLGTLQKLVVKGRTSGGFITEFEVQAASGRYLVRRESNIRNLIRPNKTFTGGGDVVLERISGAKNLNFPALPSAAFALEEERDANGVLQRVTFWGGGYGHGVGMSQFGADKLGKMGKGFKEILEHFYPGATLTALSTASR